MQREMAAPLSRSFAPGTWEKGRDRSLVRGGTHLGVVGDTADVGCSREYTRFLSGTRRATVEMRCVCVCLCLCLSIVSVSDHVDTYYTRHSVGPMTAISFFG